MNHNGKRLRDVDHPRIIFHAPERTFDRLFKESSLNDLKQTVKKKLGLPSDSSICLAQIRDGQAVDLEDDDDFEAFCTVAYSQRSVNVEIRLAGTQTSQNTEEVTRPKKKHRGNHGSPDVSNTEASVRAANTTRESKKRKVVFAASPTEGTEPGGVSEAPRRKKKKNNDGDSVVDGAVAEPGSSHDTTKVKKKSKKDAFPIPEVNYDSLDHTGAVEVSIAHEHREIPAEDHQLAGSEPTSPNDARQQSEQVSSSPRRMRTSKVKLPSGPDQTPEDQSQKEVVHTSMVDTSDTRKQPGRTPASDAQHDLNRKSTKSVAKEKGEHSAERSTSSENAQNVLSGGGQVENNTLLSSGRGIGSKSASPDAEEENRPGAEVASAEKTTEAQLKDIVARLLAEKRRRIAANNLRATMPENTGSSSKTQAKGTEYPERVDNSSKAVSEPACLVCTKAPRHDLADCPLVQEGPIAIQKRIKSLRASKKYPDEEKLPVIDGLKQIKQDIRVKAKQSKKETKVNALSHSHPSSRPQAKDVPSNRTNDVAGVSSQAQPVNRDSSQGSSGTSSTDVSLPAPQLTVERKGDGGDSLIPPHSEELSTVDLQALIRGPKEALLSVNDLPSSDENDDDEERMSGGPEEDEVEQNYPRLTSFGNNSSEDEDSDAEHENERPTGSITRIEQHDTVASSQDAIGIPPIVQEQSVPRPSGKGDLSSDKLGPVSANGHTPDSQEENAVVGTKFLVNDQPASNDHNDSMVAQETNIDPPTAQAEESDISATRALSDSSESISTGSPQQAQDSPGIEEASDDARFGSELRSGQRRPRNSSVVKYGPSNRSSWQANDNAGDEEGSDDAGFAPVRRSDRLRKSSAPQQANSSHGVGEAAGFGPPSDQAMKPSVTTEGVATERDSGKRKSTVTKTPKKGKSLTQVSDDIRDSVARTTKPKIRATSEAPSDPRTTKSKLRAASEMPPDPRTPGRKRAKATTNIERLLNSKGKDTPTAKPRKKDAPIPGENEPTSSCVGQSQDQTSLRSVAGWTTLTPSMPTEDDNSTVHEELTPSSPLSRKSTTNKKGVKKIVKQTAGRTNESLPSSDSPLFVPSASQLPYPYSQKLHVEAQPVVDRSDSEDEVTSSLTPNARTPHTYRRLSEIHEKKLFAKHLSSNPTQSQSSKTDRTSNLYGRKGKREDDVGDESDSDSDSDPEPKKKSHIPQARMAGA